MKTEEIASFDDLKNRVFGKKSGTICHYTQYERLIMILMNKSLRLSRYDLMNDVTEKKLSKCDNGDCRYIISFTGTTKENVAMWALYGKHSSIKIRLSFSRSSLIHCANDNFFFDAIKNYKIPYWSTSTIPSDYSKKNFTLSDVVYFDRQNNRFRLSGKSLSAIDVTQDRINKLAGTIKYDAWEYERECRLSAVLSQNRNKNDFHDLNHIYLGLSEEFIKGLTITYSPWINDVVITQLEKSINDMTGLQLKHRHSALQGEITAL